jgi:glycosyltransferase involved in cell wall biosynthesis
MKIGIDALGCNHGQSGAGSYLLNFIKNLPDKNECEFELFGLEIDRYTYTKNKEMPFVSVNIDENLKAIRRWHKHKLKAFCRKNKYDAVIFPAAHIVLPGKIKSKSIIILNGVYSVLGDKKEHKAIKKALNHSTLTIAASQYIKDDLIQNGFNSEKISVIHNGIDHKVFFPAADFDSEFVDIKPFAIKRPYFIYSSRLSGSDKKHIELIKAFEIFKKRTNAPHRLVLVGSDGPYAKKIQDFAYNSEYASEILITGHFPQESLQKLYCGSTACIFPAVNEGAGLPVTEAMACGVPVLCSNKGALKEMAGDAPLYFDSDDIEEMAVDMQKLIEDKNLSSQMVQKGFEVSRRINWDSTVKETIKVSCYAVSVASD